MKFTFLSVILKSGGFPRSLLHLLLFKQYFIREQQGALLLRFQKKISPPAHSKAEE